MKYVWGNDKLATLLCDMLIVNVVERIMQGRQ